VSPSPGEPLATCLPRAVSRGLGACRRPTGRTWQPARRRTLARASALRALRQQAARHVVSSSITAMSDVSPDGARSIRPTSPCSVAAVISWSTDAATGARRRPHVRCPVSTDAAVCVTHFSPAGRCISWPQQSDRLHLRLCVDPIAKSQRASTEAPVLARCATVAAPIGEGPALAAMRNSGRHPTGRFGPFAGQERRGRSWRRLPREEDGARVLARRGRVSRSPLRCAVRCRRSLGGSSQ
jgi:hypothetical protein